MKTKEQKALDAIEGKIKALIQRNLESQSKMADSLENARKEKAEAEEAVQIAYAAGDAEKFAEAEETLRKKESLVKFHEQRLEDAKTKPVIPKEESEAMKAEIKSIVKTKMEAAQKELDAIEEKGVNIILEYKNMKDRASHAFNTIEHKLERSPGTSAIMSSIGGFLRNPNIGGAASMKIAEQERNK